MTATQKTSGIENQGQISHFLTAVKNRRWLSKSAKREDGGHPAANPWYISDGQPLRGVED